MSDKPQCEAMASNGTRCEREHLHAGFHKAGDEWSAKGALAWGDTGPEFVDRIKRAVRAVGYKT